jgi:hypothetical protein
MQFHTATRAPASKPAADCFVRPPSRNARRPGSARGDPLSAHCARISPPLAAGFDMTTRFVGSVAAGGRCQPLAARITYVREETTPVPATMRKSAMQLDPATSDGSPSLSAAAQLRLSMAVAVPVCAFALLWNLSVTHYYFMMSDPAQRADFIAPSARVIQHALLLPLLIGGYFLATLPAASSGSRSRVLFQQLALLLVFSLLVRPVTFLAMCLVPGAARLPFTFANFVDAMDLDSWLSTALNYSLVYALGLFILFGLIVLAKYRQEQLRAAAMRANWLQAQLETLRVQLHPHFLFNTLNTISALVGSRPEEARDLIAQLAALLRDSIEGAGGEFYPLRREIELANKYLRIICARFGARLKPSLEVMPQLEDCPVPHGLLLTLLENAVTHGVSMVIGDSELSLRCGLERELLVVEVANRYDPDAAAVPAHRGGLSALAARLNALYGDAYTLEYGGNGAAIWYTRVRLPVDSTPVAGVGPAGLGARALAQRMLT